MAQKRMKEGDEIESALGSCTLVWRNFCRKEQFFLIHPLHREISLAQRCLSVSMVFVHLPSFVFLL
jgi:hypothetical protein